MEVEFWTFFAILYIIYTDYIHIIYIYIFRLISVALWSFLLFGAITYNQHCSKNTASQTHHFTLIAVPAGLYFPSLRQCPP